MRARNMSIKPEVWVPPPPMNEVAGFREWLTLQYSERNRNLRKAGVVVPDNPADLGEILNWDNVELEELPRILRQYRVSCEVFRALKEATRMVRYRAKVKITQSSAEIKEGEEEKKVLEIESLYFEEGGSAGGGRPGRPRAGAAAEKKHALFKEHVFTVKFIAHYGPALDFVRKLEASEVGIFVVRTAELCRIERLDVEGAFANAILAEAPVAAEVTASLVEFTE